MKSLQNFYVKDFVFKTLQSIQSDISDYNNPFAPVKFIDKVIEFKYDAIVIAISQNIIYKNEIYDAIDEMLNLLSINNDTYETFMEAREEIHNRLDKMINKFEIINGVTYER